MNEFQKEVAAWQDATFPTGTAESALEHLKREIVELVDSQCPTEAADCLLLLIAFANKKGFNLFEEAKKKFEINKTRKWAAPDEKGVSEHID